MPLVPTGCSTASTWTILASLTVISWRKSAHESYYMSGLSLAGFNQQWVCVGIGWRKRAHRPARILDMAQ